MARLALLLLSWRSAVGQPAVEVELYSTSTEDDDYLTWSPISARARLASAMPTDIAVVLSNDNPAAIPSGGDVVFGLDNTSLSPTLTVTLPSDGSWKSFLVAGAKASQADRDTVIEAHQDTAGGAIIGGKRTMVRIRKNAEKLTDDERDRFLRAVRDLRELNRYRVFQDIHQSNPTAGNPDAHGGPAFIPWHRIYILAFERALQTIDPSVALHYWKFDEPASSVFSPDFMGGNSVSASINPLAEPAVTVNFSATNPLNGWTTDLLPSTSIPPVGSKLLQRAPADRSLSPAINLQVLRSQTNTVAPTSYDDFQQTLGGNPHGWAHVWGGGMTGGSLGDIGTAVQDPMFFMLHSNVDRLWAIWQRAVPPNAANGKRYDSQANGYHPQSPATFPGAGASLHIGHYLKDTMWPWNGVTGTGGAARDQRPTSAPGGAFFVSSLFAPKSATPTPEHALDYLGRLNVQSSMGYAYDDDEYSPD